VGLGLSIVKAIAEAHGGGVGLESTEGVGTSFWFTVPLAGTVVAPSEEAISLVESPQLK
jgi:signal transduction histidine kinase